MADHSFFRAVKKGALVKVRQIIQEIQWCAKALRARIAMDASRVVESGQGEECR